MSKQQQRDNIDRHRKIRSYVRREGRFTPAQKSAYESLWPVYGLDATAEQWDFSRVFDRQSDVFLELGFGDGRVLKMLSAEYPENDYLGIEVHRPGVGRVMRELDQQGLKNVRVASEDGMELLQNNIAADSLAGILIFFPDPRHKKKNKKRLKIKTEIYHIESCSVKQGGIMHLATEAEEYEQQIEDV